MHDNFYAGIDAANMAGTWQGIVFGFAGVRSNTGELTIHPKLPEQWKSYEFCVEYHGSDMRIKIEQGKVTYKLLNQVPITLRNHEPITLNKEGEEYMSKKYKAIFFDWDGTAVMSRQAPVEEAVAAMKPLLASGVKLVIVSGTTYDKIASGKIHGTFHSRGSFKPLFRFRQRSIQL